MRSDTHLDEDSKSGLTAFSVTNGLLVCVLCFCHVSSVRSLSNASLLSIFDLSLSNDMLHVLALLRTLLPVGCWSSFLLWFQSKSIGAH